MAQLKGYVRIEVNVEVADGLDDLEQETAFNEAVEDAWTRGDLADHDYSVEDDGDDEEEGATMQEIKHPDVTVQLVGQDGNAFAILGAVSKALRRAGYGDEVQQFTDEATAGDYNDLLATAMRWVDVG